MISIGIIGAENTRSAALARLCNLDRRLAMRVTHLWGEIFPAASRIAREMSVPHALRNWKHMAGEVDGVVVAHREGRRHAAVCRWFLERGLPVFVDKPLTENLAQARRLFDLAARVGVPLGTCSALVLQKAFRDFVRSVGSVGVIDFLNASGPADLHSPFGGIFFYGVHQVDTIVECMGLEAQSAQLVVNGSEGLGIIHFSGGRIATMNCLSGKAEFHWRAAGGGGILSHLYKPDAERNLGIAKAILRLVKEGVPPAGRDRMLAPIAILQALRKSARTGRREKIPCFSGMPITR